MLNNFSTNIGRWECRPEMSVCLSVCVHACSWGHSVTWWDYYYLLIIFPENEQSAVLHRTWLSPSVNQSRSWNEKVLLCGVIDVLLILYLHTCRWVWMFYEFLINAHSTLNVFVSKWCRWSAFCWNKVLPECHTLPIICGTASHISREEIEDRGCAE